MCEGRGNLIGRWVVLLARNVGVPVYECAVGIVLPSPDMQGIERRKPEAVGGREQMKELSHEFRRPYLLLVPRSLEKQIVGASQSRPATRRRLVNYDLWMGGI